MGYPPLNERWPRVRQEQETAEKNGGTNGQESDDAYENESETTEVGESAQCEHGARIVEYISSWIRSVKIVVCLWLVYAPI